MSEAIDTAWHYRVATEERGWPQLAHPYGMVEDLTS